MTRARRTLAVLALGLWTAVACGHYGPPVRSSAGGKDSKPTAGAPTAPATDASSSAAPDDRDEQR